MSVAVESLRLQYVLDPTMQFAQRALQTVVPESLRLQSAPLLPTRRVPTARTTAIRAA